MANQVLFETSYNNYIKFSNLLKEPSVLKMIGRSLKIH